MDKDMRTALDLVEAKFASDYLLQQLAEECAGLAQAALKLIRFVNGEAPHLDKERTLECYFEELADVGLMLDMAVATLPEKAKARITANRDYECKRMIWRMEALGDKNKEGMP